VAAGAVIVLVIMVVVVVIVSVVVSVAVAAAKVSVIFAKFYAIRPYIMSIMFTVIHSTYMKAYRRNIKMVLYLKK
jgi:hypothetical protein